MIYAPDGEAIQKSATRANWTYDETTNYVRSAGGDTNWMFWGTYTTDANDKITAFTPKTTFHAVDYNNVYTKDYVDTQLSGKANTALSNLSDTGKNISNWSTNVSNCIVEIPQDIKISINASNQLELASGSTVYLGNSTAVPISTTIKQTSTSLNTRKYFVATNPAGTAIEVAGFSSAVTAASNPGTPYIMWFNTTDGKPYINGSNGTAREISFPIAIASFANGTGWTKVDQVFNGFGHIGHTVFALPGVKARIPLGRNADGTLKSRLDTLASVKTSDAYTSKFMFNAAGISPAFWTNYAEQDTQPAFANGNGTWYNTRENKMYQITGGVLSVVEVAYVLDVVLQDADHVKSVTPKLPFRAVDYKDFEDLKETNIDYKNISNCITEVPQDINLTLSSGTLTLKAGSKVYIPNGGSVFDTNMVANDLTITNQNNGTYMLFLTGLGGTLMLRNITQCSSGTTAPTPVQTYSAWYDTTNNIMKYTTSSTTWNTGASLPIALVTVSSGAISSIDKVFNGFGYIGSTVFALPGVKGLIPNGLNADGTLRSTAFIVSSVLTETTGPSGTNDLFLKADSIVQVGAGIINYDAADNYNKGTGFVSAYAIVGRTITSAGVITSFTPKTAFHAVDYSDTSYIAHQAMPSSEQYTSYSTSTASDTTFIAPADGYVYVQGQVDTAYGYCILALLDASGNIMLSTEAQTPASTGVRMFLPVSKGDTFKIEHANFTINIFRFVYANGAK